MVGRVGVEPTQHLSGAFTAPWARRCPAYPKIGCRGGNRTHFAFRPQVMSLSSARCLSLPFEGAGLVNSAAICQYIRGHMILAESSGLEPQARLGLTGFRSRAAPAARFTFQLAEAVRFELTEPRGSPSFQDGGFSRSPMLP